MESFYVFVYTHIYGMYMCVFLFVSTDDCNETNDDIYFDRLVTSLGQHWMVVCAFICEMKSMVIFTNDKQKVSQGN